MGFSTVLMGFSRNIPLIIMFNGIIPYGIYIDVLWCLNTEISS
jgi:hypothetical protein